MAWGAVLGGVISYFGQTRAADKGADASNQATQASIDEQRRQFDLTRKDQTPWLEAGTSALAQMAALNGGDFSRFVQSPDYKFALQQGVQAQDRSAAARGGLYSGGHQADLMKFGQGLASQNYNTYYNRLASLAGLGQTTASGLGSMGMGMANSIGGLNAANAQARMSSYGQQGDALSGLAQGLGNYYSYYRNRQPQQAYASGTGWSGMNYSAPSTSGGDSWLNGYGTGGG